MITQFLDTSAVLHGALSASSYISPITLVELENIKTGDRPERIKYLARQAVRDILSSQTIYCEKVNQKKVDKLLKKYNFLSNINDHRIICEAELLGQKLREKINFVTSDGAQLLFVKEMPHLNPVLYKDNKNKNEDEWCGWAKYYPTEEQLNLLYSDPKMNILKCKINEFAEIYEKNELKDILFWNGKEYRPIKYKEFTSTLGEKVRPRNIEQKMYLDLLQNKEVPVKLCIARFGTGKSWLALSYALHEVQMGNFDKIVFVKNNLEVKGAGKLGILPGSELEKQMPWLRQIEDHIGPQNFEEMINCGQIEPAHLSTLRGRDLKNCIILVDEAENLLTTNIQLLLGRVAEGSEIIFCADVKQCDYNDEKMSGIPTMIECLQDNRLFGMVKLLKTERSEVAALADLMD